MMVHVHGCARLADGFINRSNSQLTSVDISLSQSVGGSDSCGAVSLRLAICRRDSHGALSHLSPYFAIGISYVATTCCSDTLIDVH